MMPSDLQSKVVDSPRCGTPLLSHIPLQFPHSQQHRNIPAPLSHIITHLGQQMQLNGRLEATASLCLWPRLSECGCIDEVLLNIKMRAQIKGIIAGAGRTMPEQPWTLRSLSLPGSVRRLSLG